MAFAEPDQTILSVAIRMLFDGSDQRGKNILDGLEQPREGYAQATIHYYFEERTIEHVAGSMMWGIQ